MIHMSSFVELLCRLSHGAVHYDSPVLFNIRGFGFDSSLPSSISLSPWSNMTGELPRYVDFTYLKWFEFLFLISGGLGGVGHFWRDLRPIQRRASHSGYQSS